MSNIFNYNYRPSKSIERKLIIDLIRDFYNTSELKKCMYVGLGSFFFIDFKLLHKEIGLKRLINIEWEDSKENRRRFTFNKPFSCIELKWGSTTDILPTITFDSKAIVWLDYTDSLKPYMLEDIEIMATNIMSDSFFILSMNSQLAKYFNRNTNSYDVDRFRDDFGDDCLFDLESNMLTINNSHVLFRKMINEKIDQILNLRNAAISVEADKLIYQQLLLITYKDGAPMFTTGGVFIKKRDQKSLNKNKLNKYPFVRKTDDVLELYSPVLTSQETDLLNSNLPAQKSRFINKRSLKFIPEEDRIKYFEHYRYFPSYVEIRS